MSLLVLSDADIRATVTAAAAIESQRAAFTAVCSGQVTGQAVVTAYDPADDALIFAHTGAIANITGMAGKFGVQIAGNQAIGLPSVHAVVTLLRPGTGEPVACLNGATITAMRTAAGIGAAADALANPAAISLALIGSGVQAREAARMISAIRVLSGIRIWSRSADRCTALATALRAELGVRADAAASARAAVAGAGIVVTCTTSRDPVVRGSWLADGATVLTVGSYEPDSAEIDTAATLRAAATFVDERDKALATCGVLVAARAHGAAAGSQVTQIGDVLTGTASGRTAPDDIVIFHSVGLGVQDASLAWTAYQLALERGTGQRVEF